MSEQIEAECDLIMKGGITSGVVYPFTVLELAKKYRLRNIGGSSAGAIAAVYAGAAEYRRATGGDNEGFDETILRVKRLENGVSHLFQPKAGLTRLFSVLKYMWRDEMSPMLAVMRAYWFAVLIVGAFAFAWALYNFSMPDDPLSLMSVLYFCAVGLMGLAAFGGLFAAFGYFLVKRLQAKIAKNHFGICPGVQQSKSGGEALIDWLDEGIEKVAHGAKKKRKGVTTYGDLEGEGIRVEVMTTNLTEGRPYRLPFWKGDAFCFSKAEFDQLFPKPVMDFLCNEALRVPVQDGGAPSDLFHLPEKKDFPLILLARLSLSFPGLLSTVPLWKKTDGTWKQHYFSDGGICSNFPMHFFDAPLPERPTFGIRFVPYEDLSPAQVKAKTRAHLATDTAKTDDIETVGGFVGSMFFTAKDWKDNLQTELPGYADRIVEIALKENEGGFNLWMGNKTIEPMFGFGTEAGKVLMDKWAKTGATTFESHRVTRAVSFVPALERMLMSFSKAFDPSYETAIQNLDPQGGVRFPKNDRVNILLPFMNSLKALGDQAWDNYRTGNQSVTRAEIPQSLAEIRLNTREGGPEPIPDSPSAAAPAAGASSASDQVPELDASQTS